MFDIIEKEGEDDNLLLRKLKLSSHNQLYTIKNYLYEWILRSLHFYHIDNTTGREVKKLLFYADLLSGRGLYSAGERILLRAKEMAESSEMFPQLIEILYRQNNLAKWTVDPGLKDIFLRKTSEDADAVLKKTGNQFRFSVIHNRMWEMYQKDPLLRSSGQKEETEKLFQELISYGEEAADSFAARQFYYSAMGLYYEMQYDYQGMHNYHKKIVELIESSSFLPENLSSYMIELHNLLVSCIATARRDEFETFMEKFLKIPSMFPAGISGQRKNIQTRIAVSSFTLTLNMCFVYGEFDRAVRIAEDFIPRIPLYENKITDLFRISLYYEIAYSFFGAGKFRQALPWIHRIINEQRYAVHADVLTFARIMNLLTHFELGNYDLFESLLRSIYRYLLKKERLFKVESAILGFIRKGMPETMQRDEMIRAFAGLKSNLEKIMKEDPAEKQTLGIFDSISWLESKITGKPFAEAVRQKVILRS